MATIATVRVAHTATSERYDMAECVIPLAAGTIKVSERSTKKLTASGTGFSTDPVGVQWEPLGALWPAPSGSSDQSYRYILVQFPVYLAAASSGNYVDRQVTIDDTTNATISSWSIMASMTAALSSMTFRVRSTHQFTPTNNFGVVGNPGFVDMRFRWSDAQLIKQSNDSQREAVRYYRIRARGDANLAAGGALVWGELVVKLCNNMPHARFWLSVGNSMITPDSNRLHPNPVWYFPRTTAGSNTDGLWCDIVGPRSAFRHSSKKVYNTIENAGPQDVSRLLFNPNNGTTGLYYEFLMDGQALGYKGVLLFDDAGLSTVLQNTLVAEAQDQTWAIAETWDQVNNFGPFGYVAPRPSNSKINSEATARSQAFLLDRNEYSSYSSPGRRNVRNPVTSYTADHYLDHEPYSNLLDASGTGDQHDYGVAKCNPFIIGRMPIMKYFDLAVLQEWCRPYHFKEWDVTPFEATKHRANDPSRFTDVFFWNGYIWMGNFNTPSNKNPPNADWLGKNAKKQELGGGMWKPYERRHSSLNMVSAYAMLTGDYGALEMVHNCMQFHFTMCQSFEMGGLRGDELISARETSRAVGRCMLLLGWAYLLQTPSDGTTRSFDCYSWLFRLGEDWARDKWWWCVNPNSLSGQFYLTRSPWYGGPFSLNRYGTVLQPDDILSYGEIYGNCEGRNQVVYANDPVTALTTWLDGIGMMGLWVQWKLFGHQWALDHFKLMCRRYHLYCYKTPATTSQTVNIVRCETPGPRTTPWPPIYQQAKALNAWSSSGQAKYPGLNTHGGADWDWLSHADVWSWWSAFIGYDLAQADSDVEWAERCRALIEGIRSSLCPDNNPGPYGFGFGSGNESSDQINWCTVANPWRSRDLQVKDLSATISGTNTITATMVKDHALTATISGVGNITAVLAKESGPGPGNPVIDLTATISGVNTITDPDGNDPSLEVLGQFRDLTCLIGGFSSLTATLESAGSFYRDLTALIGGYSSLEAGLSVVRPAVASSFQVSVIYDSTRPVTIILGDDVLTDNFSFQMFAGDDIAVVVSLKNPDGTPVDITSIDSAVYQMFDPNTDSVVFTKSLASGISLVDAVNGQIAVYFNEADTEGRYGDYEHELEIEIDGTTTTVFTGVPTIKRTRIA